MKKTFLILFALIFNFYAFSQNNTDRFDKFSQTSFGALFNVFNGNISEYISGQGGGNLDISMGRNKKFFGINMDFVVLKKKKNFTTPPGYEHYKQPSIMNMGLHFGSIYRKSQKTYLQTLIGLGYSSIYHKKKDKEISTYDGVSPFIELAKFWKIGNVRYSEMQYTSNFTPPRYDPSLTFQYIGLFVGYRRLIMNNNEGNGNMFSLGLKYVFTKYSIANNKN